MDYKVSFARYRSYTKYLEPVARSRVFQAYFSIVASLVAIILLVALAIRPTLITIISLDKEIEDKRELNQKMDRKINEIAVLNEKYRQIKPDLKLIYGALPKDPESLNASFLLELTATVAGVRLETISGLETNFLSTVSGQIFIPSLLSASGDYPSIKHLLSEISQGQRLFSFKSLDFGPVTTVDKLSDIPINLKGGYWYMR